MSSTGCQGNHKPNKYEEQEMKSKLLEQLYVHDVYDRIAIDFEDEQYKPLPKVKDFLLSLEPGSLVADIGCGNGHYLNVNPNIAVIGVDRSSNLLHSANHRVTGVTCRSDCLSLPFRDNLFDAILFIGVIHHLVSSRRQSKSLRELSRVLRPGGTILLYTWAWEQQKRKFCGQNVLVPRHVVCERQGDTLDIKSCNCRIPNLDSCNATPPLPLTYMPSVYTPGLSNHKPSIQNRFAQMFFGPTSLFHKLLRRKDSVDSSHDDCSSTDSVHSDDTTSHSTPSEGAQPSLTSQSKEVTSAIRLSLSTHAGGLAVDQHTVYIHDSIVVPEEFRVREFPASSLFPAPKSQTSIVNIHSRNCESHCSSPVRSRDDRFYHLFKKGELEKLVKSSTPNLVVSKCTYSCGHWCATLTKT